MFISSAFSQIIIFTSQLYGYNIINRGTMVNRLYIFIFDRIQAINNDGADNSWVDLGDSRKRSHSVDVLASAEPSPKRAEFADDSDEEL